MFLMDAFNPFAGFKLWNDSVEYLADSFQRNILFWDVLRKRGNNYFEHLEEGQPPVLAFEYKLVKDGKSLERPVNYSLVEIVERRHGEESWGEAKESRTIRPFKDVSPEKMRPILIVDPRAGHGPGIGGTQKESGIGNALDQGHHVYFLVFETDPIPGQTLADVKNAEIFFLEEIRKRHPEAPRPAVIGNCQGGWAMSIVTAERPDLVGPLLLNGSPLSYWSGRGSKDPMRYSGGLLGGVWNASFLSDLGGGVFDGAHLIQNFEMMHPANTLWSKHYNLYANIDTEEERFLKFEKWWGGFYLLTREEIHQIVRDLFIGNQLAHGVLELEPGNVTDLKKISAPVLVFCSEGDNITPPQQALHWIPEVYKSTEELKRCRQVIIYIVHPEIGHLGIFVSTAIAKKEQKELIGSVEMIRYLPPGLYEMIVEKGPTNPWSNDYQVRFEERDVEVLKDLDQTSTIDEEAFRTVARISENGDLIYSKLMSPWVRALVTPLFAETLRQLHPLRQQRVLISDLNPWLLPLKTLAPLIKQNPIRVREGNVFKQLETTFSDVMTLSLDVYQDLKEQTNESLFQGIYENPFLKPFLPPSEIKAQRKQSKEEKVERAAKQAKDQRFWHGLMKKGGYEEGIIRIIIAFVALEGIVETDQLVKGREIVFDSKRLVKLKSADIKEMALIQARILQTDQKKALAALNLLITSPEDRVKALNIAQEIVNASAITEQKKGLLESITAILS
ncbi:MAG: poly(3-hydroxyalkanoate) synthetase [SAR324 cluster bacterium]|uniref:Poly(3-hydroxyalkanoate) synthetase n=1 Tax=SAR324 cluster bacterium TaxID=2024889 RepID=A0A2A4SZN9_9DELT|nr:MAG: poly(3-hydroxyalkanoate) synthetase [SAR324 cluster bacterium]